MRFACTRRTGAAVFSGLSGRETHWEACLQRKALHSCVGTRLGDLFDGRVPNFEIPFRNEEFQLPLLFVTQNWNYHAREKWPSQTFDEKTAESLLSVTS